MSRIALFDGQIFKNVNPTQVFQYQTPAQIIEHVYQSLKDTGVSLKANNVIELGSEVVIFSFTTPFQESLYWLNCESMVLHHTTYENAESSALTEDQRSLIDVEIQYYLHPYFDHFGSRIFALESYGKDTSLAF